MAKAKRKLKKKVNSKSRKRCVYKNVYNVVNNNEKENVTVLVTANAAGRLAPPLVLFSGKSIPKDAVQVAPPNYSLGFSDNGWMTAKNFFEYIANVFQPWLEESGIELPVVLFIDGHSSHMTLPLSKFCDEKKNCAHSSLPKRNPHFTAVGRVFFPSIQSILAKNIPGFLQKYWIYVY